MESSPRDAEPGSEGESPSQDSAADDRELASECSVESQPESMPASDLFSLFDEGVEKHGGFYRDLFRMELIFNEACTCNDCKSAVAEAIDQSLTLLQTTRTLLLCFADLPADELGCEGLRLISYETLLSDADTPQGRVHMLETHINHGLLELSRLLGKRLLAKTVRKRLQSLAETLEQNILQPLDDVITAASAVVFVAFGSCAEVPFGAILWHGRPLMLQLPTSYATSVADLARMATLVPDLEHCDLIVASATHSPAVGGSLPCVPLAGVEAAMLQNKLSRNSEQRTADADGQHGNKKLTCLAHATCDELMSCLGNCDIADTLKDHIRYGFQPELALFHYSGHVAEGAFEDSSDAWPQEALAKQLCLTDGEYDLGGVLDTAKNYTSLIYISACCGDELACHQSRHSKTGCPGHGGNGAAVVCCTWPLSDIAGLVLCQDFYTALINLVKDTGGSKHQASNENGVAEALRSAMESMACRTRTDLQASAEDLERQLSSSLPAGSEGELVARGLAALRGLSPWLQTSQEEESEEEQDPEEEPARRGAYNHESIATCSPKASVAGDRVDDEQFYLSCILPFFWAGYRCYGIPLGLESPDANPSSSASGVQQSEGHELFGTVTQSDSSDIGS